MAQVGSIIYSLNYLDQNIHFSGKQYSKSPHRSSQPGDGDAHKGFPNHQQGRYLQIDLLQLLQKCSVLYWLKSMCMVISLQKGKSFFQDPDDHWRIGWESAIKAKSVTGYATFNRKLTQNRCYD